MIEKEEGRYIRISENTQGFLLELIVEIDYLGKTLARRYPEHARICSEKSLTKEIEALFALDLKMEKKGTK